MDRQSQKTARRSRRRSSIRKRVQGTPSRPRLAIYRSLHHIYAQVIDDLGARTLVAASTREKGFDADGASPGSVAAAARVGQLVAERAKAAGVEQITFDRGGFKYHGRVKALADAARESGLSF